MPNCEIKCPYCELTFKHEVDKSEDIYDDQFIECSYCEQTIQVTFDVEVTPNIWTESDKKELKEMKKIGKQKKDELFIIKLGTKHLAFDCYLSDSDEFTGNKNYVKLFRVELVAKNWVKEHKKEYPDATVVKYKDFDK